MAAVLGAGRTHMASAGQVQGKGHHWAALLAELPVEVAAAAVQEVARRSPALKQTLLDAWLIEDYAAEVGGFLAEVGAHHGPGEGIEETTNPSGGDTDTTATKSELDMSAASEDGNDTSPQRRCMLVIAYFPRSAT